jgi:hypothetical protein
MARHRDYRDLMTAFETERGAERAEMRGARP